MISKTKRLLNNIENMLDVSLDDQLLIRDLIKVNKRLEAENKKLREGLEMCLRYAETYSLDDGTCDSAFKYKAMKILKELNETRD